MGKETVIKRLVLCVKDNDAAGANASSVGALLSVIGVTSLVLVLADCPYITGRFCSSSAVREKDSAIAGIISRKRGPNLINNSLSVKAVNGQRFQRVQIDSSK